VEADCSKVFLLFFCCEDVEVNNEEEVVSSILPSADGHDVTADMALGDVT
jgi:hypothetical protein